MTFHGARHDYSRPVRSHEPAPDARIGDVVSPLPVRSAVSFAGRPSCPSRSSPHETSLTKPEQSHMESLVIKPEPFINQR